MSAPEVTTIGQGQAGPTRGQRIKKDYNEAIPSICIERAVCYTRSHRETGGQPLIVRRARAFQEACEHIPVTIYPNELIVSAIGEERGALAA